MPSAAPPAAPFGGGAVPARSARGWGAADPSIYNVYIYTEIVRGSRLVGFAAERGGTARVRVSTIRRVRGLRAMQRGRRVAATRVAPTRDRPKCGPGQEPPAAGPRRRPHSAAGNICTARDCAAGNSFAGAAHCGTSRACCTAAPLLAAAGTSILASRPCGPLQPASGAAAAGAPKAPGFAFMTGCNGLIAMGHTWDLFRDAGSWQRSPGQAQCTRADSSFNLALTATGSLMLRHRRPSPHIKPIL